MGRIFRIDAVLPDLFFRLFLRRCFLRRLFLSLLLRLLRFFRLFFGGLCGRFLRRTLLRSLLRRSLFSVRALLRSFRRCLLLPRLLLQNLRNQILRLAALGSHREIPGVDAVSDSLHHRCKEGFPDRVCLIVHI